MRLPEDFQPAEESALGTPAVFQSWYAGWYSGDPGAVDPAWFDWEGIAPYYLDVYRTLLQVPFGRVCTYGALAAGAGRSAAVRAAASAMAANPFPLIIPCHRVIPSSLHAGTYAGVSGNPVKVRLLQRENPRLICGGKIRKEYLYQPEWRG